LNPTGLSRRNFLGVLTLGSASVAFQRPLHAETPAQRASDKLLDEIERRACLYFYEMSDPNTGLVRDRARVGEVYASGVASIAATGFGLSSLAIAANRGYLERDRARERVRATLRFLCDRSDQQQGFFYHFVDSSTGKRVWRSEVSSVDTGWLLCGVLHSRASWDDPEIRKLATELLNRADWQWMLNGSETLCHGWTPERGFLPYRWDAYSELLAIYLLALSSETHPIPASSWNAWKRPMRDFEGIFFIDASTPLFVHQYSHAWFDFRGRVDRYANYFQNSARATQAHRLYCMGLAGTYPWYGPNMWGVTASDSRSGYRSWCSSTQPADGTLVPCAAGGSLVFLPDTCGAVLQNMFDTYGTSWSKYGFVDAFQPGAGWYSPCVIGIDLGIMLLMAENTRSGAVWDAIMSTPEAQRGMEAVGLKLLQA
jgi:hypothetical protein